MSGNVVHIRTRQLVQEPLCQIPSGMSESELYRRIRLVREAMRETTHQLETEPHDASFEKLRYDNLLGTLGRLQKQL